MASQKSSRNQQQLVSTMIRQGFISGPFLSPPPSIRPAPGPMNPTLFEMIAIEQSREPKPKSDSHKKVQERVSEALARAPFRNHEQWGMGDVMLTVSEAGEWESAAFRVSMDVHRRVLASKSRFFAEKLRRIGAHSVEILECDDVEVYVEAVVLMYSDDVKTKLIGMEVSKVLSLLKVSSALLFDDGIKTCLEYLEAIPWSEDDEERVVSHLNQLQLDESRTDALLQRLTAEPSTSASADEIFLKLSFGVLQAKDDKSRKEMKVLISRLLKDDANNHGFDITRDTLYNLCDRCLCSLVLCLSEATCLDESVSDRGTLMGEIAREADNMQWIVGILIDRKMGDEFVKLWGDQKELAILHSKIPSLYRHEISKITALLCISIGRGHILVPKDTRFSLLSTWLVALYDDFRWMRRAGKSIDRNLIEEGLCRTILTLSLPQQQSILLDWFNRFLNVGDDCPNIQRAFEIWWRRAFVKRYTIELQPQIMAHDVLNQSDLT